MTAVFDINDIDMISMKNKTSETHECTYLVKNEDGTFTFKYNGDHIAGQRLCECCGAYIPIKHWKTHECEDEVRPKEAVANIVAGLFKDNPNDAFKIGITVDKRVTYIS